MTRLLPALCALVLAPACTSSSTSATAAAIDQACTNVAQARCDKRALCTNMSGITRSYGSMSTCLEREKLSCTTGLQAPDTGNTPALIAQCTAAYAGLSCADFLDNNPPAVCTGVGPRADGSPCAFNGQCQSSYCSGDRNSACGTCGSPPAVGESCQSSFCERGQLCVTATQMCQHYGAVGDSCEGTMLPCGADLNCVGATATAPGTCQATSAVLGSSCDAKSPCDGTVGLHCEAAGGLKTCTATTYAGDGMPCGLVGAGFVGCGGGGACYTSTGLAASGQTGSCKAAVSDGAACDNVLGPPCLSPARCIASGSGTQGICTIPDGSSCG